MTQYLIETMPEHLRDSHRAAGNWGDYPHNGAERSIVDESELPDEDDEYDHVVREATAKDIERYTVIFATPDGVTVRCYTPSDLADWIEAFDDYNNESGEPPHQPETFHSSRKYRSNQIMKTSTHFITELTTSAGSTFFHEGGKTNYRAMLGRKAPRSDVLKIMTRNPNARHPEEWPEQTTEQMWDDAAERARRIYIDAMNH